MSVKYDKTNWIDRQTPVNAENLNKLEDATEYLYYIAKDLPANEEDRRVSEIKRRDNESARIVSEKDRNRTFDDKISQVNRVKEALTTQVSNKMNEVEGFVNIKNAQVDDKIVEIDYRFSQLTSQQQQDAEVIDARGNSASLKDELRRIEFTPQTHFEDVEG